MWNQVTLNLVPLGYANIGKGSLLMIAIASFHMPHSGRANSSTQVPSKLSKLPVFEL